MRNTLLLLSIIILGACSKSGNKISGDCDSQMIARFEDQITCAEIPTNGPCHYLAKGLYKGEKIYFLDIICATCNTVPPQEGYNCDGEKIVIENFTQTVTEVEYVSPEITE